jgi:hypothetical protein
MRTARRLRRHPVTRPRPQVVEQHIRRTLHPASGQRIPGLLGPTAQAVPFV